MLSPTNVGGGAMRWFGKQKPAEVWDEPIQWPLGDIEAAERIRSICRSAADSAEFVGGHAARADDTKRSEQKQHEVEAARYQRAAKAAMEIAMKLSDALMRDAAVREIVDLCLTAGDVRTARILFRAIQAPAIRDPMLIEHPELLP
ncbi:hypothetical protein [Bradyrhizobium sp.]|uniref:hypothetical protein n=1 Tax=Bradyrhizobium sp. TaxID=376 RepID=UPI002D1FC1AB|nr:hypothetical protein [Bradyrhizobium sp.]